ncbi:hypothetical protein NKW44_11030 [Acetobacter lovaniensis]|jgi:hypothetical protein|uniref:hypothetical protein n=1 Tax=Acetobacter lovaniensis TaxID=104100 RepID=UPI00209F27B8|nr:hypothetical protein [Acetobacter lovaniensis]MCI1698772.1 hypothetical protein [Acetobacter lovaniensis]MCP1240220.1 hypothetical protein [Acetobacter lovaniensis]
MTTSTNWPNSERPGVPLFPEQTLRHVLKKKDTGEIIIRNWKSDGQHWDMIGYSAQWCSETYFYEGACLTPTQISEMLSGERERCARECDEKVAFANHELTASGSHEETRYWIGEHCAATFCADAIRGLGDKA